MMNPERKPDSWFGTFSLEENQAGCWKLGSCTFWLQRSMDEWRLTYEPGVDPLSLSFQVDVPFMGDSIPGLQENASESVEINRFSFRRTGPKIRIQPLLADRAVVVRPEMPLYIPVGETVSMYVSTPVWTRIEAGSPKKTLREFPLIRPSDTWFGPNTMDGELCYNTRTNGRFRLEDLPLRRNRAITPIQIRNEASDALLLQRVRLPVKHLSLFVADDGYLWTELVTLERRDVDEEATLKIGEGPPKHISGAAMVSGPRDESKSNIITRPFTMLFQKTGEA